MHPEIPAQRSSCGSQLTAQHTEDGKKPPSIHKKSVWNWRQQAVQWSWASENSRITVLHCPCNPWVFSSAGSGSQRWPEPQVSAGSTRRVSPPAAQPHNASLGTAGLTWGTNTKTCGPRSHGGPCLLLWWHLGSQWLQLWHSLAYLQLWAVPDDAPSSWFHVCFVFGFSGFGLGFLFSVFANLKEYRGER